MPASLSSSERVSQRAPGAAPQRVARVGSEGSRSTVSDSWIRACALTVCVASILGSLAGCVTVRPEEREFLADPAMTFGSEGEVGAHEAHVLSNREGSAGASGVTGGGCGCN